MKKIRLFFLLVVLISTKGFAQQGGEYDPYLSNPSLGGYNEIAKVGLLYQRENTAYDYSPKSFILWGSSPFNNQRIAAGFKVASQEGGVLKNTSAEAHFIYFVPVGGSRLSFALGGNFNQLQLMRERVQVHDPTDPILQGAESGSWYNANFGIALSQVNKYYFGFAAYNLLPSQTNWMVSSFENRSHITYVASGMYSINLFQGDWRWEISTILATNNPSDFDWLHYEFSNKIMIKKDLWIGAGYGNETCIKGTFGINVQNLSFAYTGYYSFGDPGKYGYSFTKHEIVLIVKFPYSKTSKSTGS